MRLVDISSGRAQCIISELIRKNTRINVGTDSMLQVHVSFQFALAPLTCYLLDMSNHPSLFPKIYCFAPDRIRLFQFGDVGREKEGGRGPDGDSLRRRPPGRWLGMGHRWSLLPLQPRRWRHRLLLWCFPQPHHRGPRGINEWGHPGRITPLWILPYRRWLQKETLGWTEAFDSRSVRWRDLLARF